MKHRIDGGLFTIIVQFHTSQTALNAPKGASVLLFRSFHHQTVTSDFHTTVKNWCLCCSNQEYLSS